MFISITTVMWSLFAAASACAFMIGRHYGEGDKDATIENTIHFLVDGGYVRWRNKNGEIELIPLDEKNHNEL